MKTLLKFTLLSSLIIGGRLARQPVPIAAAQTVEAGVIPVNFVVSMQQMLHPRPVNSVQKQPLPQRAPATSLAGMF